MGIHAPRCAAASASSRASAAFFSHARAFLHILSPHYVILFRIRTVILICTFPFCGRSKTISKRAHKVPPKCILHIMSLLFITRQHSQSLQWTPAPPISPNCLSSVYPEETARSDVWRSPSQHAHPPGARRSPPASPLDARPPSPARPPTARSPPPARPTLPRHRQHNCSPAHRSLATASTTARPTHRSLAAARPPTARSPLPACPPTACSPPPARPPLARRRQHACPPGSSPVRAYPIAHHHPQRHLVP
jgi:hypothetical protein